MVTELTLEKEPSCRDAQRRANVLAHPVLNGIDFVEYQHRPLAPQPHVLVVHFLKDLPAAPHSDPDGAYGLTTHPEWIRLEGGTRIVNIKVLAVTLAAPRLEIAVDKPGDFSTYWLFLGWSRQPDGSLKRETANLDARFSRAPVDFKADCPTEFDCRETPFCPPEALDGPLLDYLAKDYASFRQLILDLIAQRNPDWQEQNPADLGITLVELLAYAGDHLSYFQDAVANEAYLETARQRFSVRRHARLVDYVMGEGRNAWTYAHLTVGSTGTVPQGTKLLTRIADPLAGETAPPPVTFNESALDPGAYEADPALRRARVFETTHPIAVRPEFNTLYLHAWGNLECCLPVGTTTLYVYALDPGDADQVIRPALQAGDYLIFEEVLGPETGLAPDADPKHRQAVRLVKVEEADDSVYGDTLLNGALQVRTNPADPVLPLLKITWDRSEALRFPLCLSTRTRDNTLVNHVSVARGNVVLADHGRTIVEDFPQSEPVPADERFYLQLGQGPLSFQCQPPDMRYRNVSGTAVQDSPRHGLDCSAGAAQAAVAVVATSPIGAHLWTAVPHLLDSPPYARHFVVETDNRGRARLRFGDGQYGKEAAGVTRFTVTYRLGNGRAGNIGADALAHALRPAVAPAWPTISALRNPLPAVGGTDPESLDQVRARAPKAFRARQFRAVTEADYIEAALRLPAVAGAMARFRWTGSWYTVELAVDPVDPADLLTLPGGRTRLAPRFGRAVKAHVSRFKLAGYDLSVRAGEYVPLEIDIRLCVQPGYFRGEVLEAVSRALSARINPDGSRGFFHPDNFSFGQPVYLSRLYQALEAVTGVDSAQVTRLRVFGQDDNGELATGVLPIGPWQIARLDNDPNFQENGVLRLSAGGGK
ncbi:MAG TPA: putative baseplate assembly protein [Gammaproteobacteria bacterium]|nr:putative baseplate assembly protein [Gammaproteobacteria bacterium]